MFEDIAGLDAAGVLAVAVGRRRSADRAEADLLGTAAHWADLHAVVPGEESARVPVPGMQRLVRLAGPGTPEVAEFAPAELGAALGMSSFAGACLVGDALELRHRLPRCWARVQAGTLRAWRARRIADATKILPPAGAAWVDAQVVGFADKVGSKRLTDLVAVALVRFDPAEAARRANAARDRRGVRVAEEISHGNRSVVIEADAFDVAVFDQTITAIAEALAALGDEDRLDLRRARAVGVIADPEGVLDLLAAAARGTCDDGAAPAEQADIESHPPTTPTAPTTPTTPTAPTAPTTPTTPTAKTAKTPDGNARDGRGRGVLRWGRAKPVLYLHVHADAVRAHGPGAVGRVEGAGMVLAGQVEQWLGAADWKIQPVIDLADGTAVDAYECPGRVTEIVTLRNPCCPFPWCNNLSRNKDDDHIKPYRSPDHGGPPGQTGPDNIARLCRRHHRLKTHGGWSYTMPEPGMYLWRSPRGHRYLVDQAGTTNLATELPDTG